MVTAVSAPGLHYLGSVVVPEKTNEIPAVHDLCERLDLQGRLVSIDALHTQTQTARAVVLEHGGDYLLTVKANPPGLQATVQAQVPDPSSPFLIPCKILRRCAGPVWKKANRSRAPWSRATSVPRPRASPSPLKRPACTGNAFRNLGQIYLPQSSKIPTTRTKIQQAAMPTSQPMVACRIGCRSFSPCNLASRYGTVAKAVQIARRINERIRDWKGLEPPAQADSKSTRRDEPVRPVSVRS